MYHWGPFVAAISGPQLVAACGAATAVGGGFVGIIFRAAAAAWREEKEAAVEKADRLEEIVQHQSEQIDQLTRKVEDLEKRTDYEGYAERTSREHREIVDGLAALGRGIDATTIALEFMSRHLFPTSLSPEQG